MVSKEKYIICLLERGSEPLAGRAHVLNGVVEIIEIIAQENGGGPSVGRTNVVDYSGCVVNVGNDETGWGLHFREILMRLGRQLYDVTRRHIIQDTAAFVPRSKRREYNDLCSGTYSARVSIS